MVRKQPLSERTSKNVPEYGKAAAAVFLAEKIGLDGTRS